MTTVASKEHRVTTVASKVLFGPFSRGGHVEGFVAAGWEPVRAAFEANFAEDLELSSQLCIYHGRRWSSTVGHKRGRDRSKKRLIFWEHH